MDLREGLETEVQRQLELIDSVPKGSKEQAVITEDLTKLVGCIDRLNQTEYEFYDRQERREIDRKKNESMLELENKKSEIGFTRAAFELAKVIIPPVITLVAYDRFQKRIIKFEETGRLVSTAARELHLPKFLR